MFEPGMQTLKCPYCATENTLEAAKGQVGSEDFLAELQRISDKETIHEAITIKCGSCGAQTTLGEDQTAGNCPFCGVPIVATAATHKSIRPHSLLPFALTLQQAGQSFRQWVGRVWFAPSGFAAHCEKASMRGMYLPAWTYDADAATAYSGERGDDYTVSETYTTTVNGRTVTQTRLVTKTRWTYVTGNVDDRFENILVMASTSLPHNELQSLQPWDLQNLVPYSDEFLSGFVSESYQVTLPQGFAEARTAMEGVIRRSVERDIGGNHQRISALSTQYNNVGYKHLLLPTWVSAYRYGEKTYRFLVNARTGRVRGQRPYSAIKILLAIGIGIAAAIGAFILLRSMGQ